MPGGILKFVGTPPAVALAVGPPGDVKGMGLLGVVGCLLGAPWRPRWKAFIRAAISALTFNPLPLLEKVGWFGGLRAALMVPRGVEDAVMPAVVGVTLGPVDKERGESRGGSREDIAGGAGLGGAEGVGSGTWSVEVASGDSTIVTGS